jgi:hypothetical protein
MKRHTILQAFWYLLNGLLLASICFLLYAIAWEYSTRQYLKGFSDAVVPASVSQEEKAEAILFWMEHGPSRRTTKAPGVLSERDPEETLNYQALLRICGTATNAFVNLANSSGLPTRRLILLDRNLEAKHVVAEVRFRKRWVVVDPSFRAILRDATGRLLTANDLRDPQVFTQATVKLAGYDSSYSYEQTTNLRWARLPLIGKSLQNLIVRRFPTWDDPIFLTLLVERESYAAVALALVLLVFSYLARVFLRRYREKRFGLSLPRLRWQLTEASGAFFRRPNWTSAQRNNKV